MAHSWAAMCVMDIRMSRLRRIQQTGVPNENWGYLPTIFPIAATTDPWPAKEFNPAEDLPDVMGTLKYEYALLRERLETTSRAFKKYNRRFMECDVRRSLESYSPM
mmetsp:Transcript_51100/g.121407  ORF Transcript_51100/g.121407 Transcript_51100/m.121407 type:complete len:106 (-) Transcript_51100:185-502(-)|eukprot:CAMPEP_0178390138 /NCGR_PEP_ID=MMETSP0689_2-20121128/10490_1 /TAXON_ID=160604 /ORGANISM="Amphidinium massartii, Strain CS-259" /LENGTH=105 /DNA_ID=CAMNT_0020010635 /DNA_START=103 /DNA_END=420 /DNA_ORIENTATION=-